MYILEYYNTIIYYYLLFYLFSQLGLQKYSSTSTSLTTSIIIQFLLVLDLRSAFVIVPRSMFRCKISNFGLSTSYVNWIHSYLLIDTPHLLSLVALFLLILEALCFLKIHLRTHFLTFSLTILVFSFNTPIISSKWKVYNSTIYIDDCKILRCDMDYVRK
jgi:hypothetical protein